MRIDLHCHALGNGKDLKKVDEEIYFNADDNHYWFTRILYNMVEGDLGRMGADFNRDGTISTDEYFELIYTLLAQSEEEKDRLSALLPRSTSRVVPLPPFDMFSELRISKDEARRRLQLPADALVLLFFGIVREYKGLNQ